MSTIINDAPAGGTQAELVKQLNSLIADVALLRTNFNTHTHSTGAVAAPDTAFQDPALVAVAITLLK